MKYGSKNRIGVDMAHLLSNSMNEETLDKMVGILKTLAHPLRLQIACYLLEGERSVCDIVKCTNDSQPNVYQQMYVLDKGGFVKARRKGIKVIYSLSEDSLKNIIAALRAEM